MIREGWAAPTTARTIPGLLVKAAGWCAVGFLGALLVLVSHGDVGRYQVMSVLSGSMVPTLGVGDLVVAKVVPPDQLQAGELATFRMPETGKLTTHRVQSIIWHGKLADVVTRGDANEVGENWSVSKTDKVGEVVARFPRLGLRRRKVLATPAGQLGLAGVATLLGLWILVVLGRPSHPDRTTRRPRALACPPRTGRPQQRTDAGTATSREGSPGPAAAVAAAGERPLAPRRHVGCAADLHTCGRSATDRRAGAAAPSGRPERTST